METTKITAMVKFKTAFQKAKTEKATTFHLSNTDLSTIPNELWTLTHLKNLSLSYNQFQEIPEEISKLTNLEILSVSHNQLRSFPKALSKLPLKKLSIGNNNFTALPDCIFNCEQLELLHFGNMGMGMTADKIINKIQVLPENIGALKNLKALNTSGNLLSSLPDALFDLKKLETLVLTGISNLWWSKQISRDLPRAERREKRREVMAQKRSIGLSEISPKIGQLEALKKLTLNFNRLDTLPEEIGQLTHLQSLEIQDNRLKSLTKSISSLSKLQVLSIGGNRFELLPDWIGKLPSLNELRVFGNPIYDSGKKDNKLKLALSKIDYIDMYSSRR